MVNFQWYEPILFGLPFIYILGIKAYIKPQLDQQLSFRLTLAMLLIPLWFVLIDAFSLLLYGFSLKIFCLFILAFLLGVQLYEYVQKIEVFAFRPYLYHASHLIFVYFSANLVGLMLTRLWSYLVK